MELSRTSCGSTRQREADILGNLGILSVEQGSYAEAKTYYERALQLDQSLGDREGESRNLVNLGNLFLYLGAYAESRLRYAQALAHFQASGSRDNEAWTLGNLGLLAYYLGERETALEYCQTALGIARELGDQSAQGTILMQLGLVLANLAEAAEACRESVALRRRLGQAHLALEPLAGLTRIALAQGKTAPALGYVEEILKQSGTCSNLAGLIDPFRVCLTCFQALRGIGDARAPEILHQAHGALLERAAKISDAELRVSYLQNVASHRELINYYNEFHISASGAAMA